MYRARDIGTGQAVAVKISTDPADAATRRSLERETRRLGSLGRHPNIVTLHGSRTLSGGRLVLVLELGDGSLAQRLAAGGWLTAREVLATGVALAGALETVHRAGLVHGAVDPGHVLVTGFGGVVLTGLGHAETAERADPEEDVHQLARTLRDLATAGVPDAAVTPAAAEGHLPTDLAVPLGRALSSDRDHRPRTALEFGQLLRTAELAAGWTPTACYVGGSEDGWATPLATDSAGRPGRAAMITGIPALGLPADPLETASWSQPRVRGPRGSPEITGEEAVGPSAAPPLASAGPGDARSGVDGDRRDAHPHDPSDDPSDDPGHDRGDGVIRP